MNTRTPHILLTIEDSSLRDGLTRFFNGNGYAVIQIRNMTQLEVYFRTYQGEANVVILDMDMSADDVPVGVVAEIIMARGIPLILYADHSQRDFYQKYGSSPTPVRVLVKSTHTYHCLLRVAGELLAPTPA